MNLGLGMYIWKVPYAASATISGEPASWQLARKNAEIIADMAVSAGLDHILIKVANGAYSYNISSNGIDHAVPLVDALRARNITVWGWQYVYGYDPKGEALRALRRIDELQLDGFVVDAEAEYKQPGKSGAAKVYMKAMRARVESSFPLALSSYRFPSQHPQLPWREFLTYVDINLPQVYWQQRPGVLAPPGTAGKQLRQSVKEFDALSKKFGIKRPYIPTGAAYREHGWQAHSDEVKDFLDTAKELGLPGANFWEWWFAKWMLPALWDVISAYPWGGSSQPPPVPSPPQEPPTITGWRLKAGFGGVNIREKPWRSGPEPRILWTLKAGEMIYLGLERDGLWARTFVMSDGRPSGWLRADFLEKA